MLIPNPKGHYRFLEGIAPFSSGVIADDGYEVVHVTLARLLPWREGFQRIDAYLRAVGGERTALCGIELRSPRQRSLDEFTAFNEQYCAVLKEWDLYVQDQNPIPRTNVVPVNDPPTETMLHAFSYIRPCQTASRPTFVVAGAGDLRDRNLGVEGIIRRGETDTDAMREKASYVMQIMAERLRALGAGWELVNMVNIYTAHPITHLVREVVLPRLADARRHGVHWYPASPPVIDLEYEMDMRGVEQELYIDLTTLSPA